MTNKPEKMYLKVFTVEGTGCFPVDMLRFDSCVPCTEGDAMQIQRTFQENRGKFDEPRRVRLRKYSVLANSQPAWARWDSFGWREVAS